MTEGNLKNHTASRSGNHPTQPPSEIPDHQMLRLIGSGSYGHVWLARNVMGFFRAVKVVHRDRFADDRPYQREFEGIRSFEPVSHFPSQVNISHVGRNERDGYFYYVMELADDRQSGQQIDPADYEPMTLRSELKLLGRFPFNQCLELGLALAAALNHLHNNGLVHRDIKPANVIFVNGQAKLADIGLVAAAEGDCSFVGTEGYVPPEGPGGVQADIYALGKVLYQMSTGQDAAEYPSLPSGELLKPELQELNQVVNRACEANTTRRYKTVDDMTAELELLKSKKSLVRVRRLERTVRLALVSAAVLAIILVLGGLVTALIVFNNRAALENWMRQLREIRLARTGSTHSAGWFTNDWARLKRASQVRRDPEVLEQGVAILAGLDAHPVAAHPGEVGAWAAFNSKGEALVGGIGESPALLLNTNGTKTELAACGEGPVCWAPDGAPLQFVALANALVLVDARSNALRWQMPRDRTWGAGTPSVLAITTDGSRVAAGLGERVRTWSTSTGECVGEAEGAPSRLAFSPDGLLLAFGMKNGTVDVRAVPGLETVATLRPVLRGGEIRAMAFGHDPLLRYGPENRSNSWLLAVADTGAGIAIWDLGLGLPRVFCRGSPWSVQSLAFDPQGLTLASAGQVDRRLWDVASGRLLLSMTEGSGSNCRALAFNAEGNRLVHGCEPTPLNITVGLWEMHPPRGIQVLRGLAAPIHQIWFSSDTRWVAALSDDWHVAIWDVARGRLRSLMEVPPGVVADNAGGCFDSSAGKFAFATWHEASLWNIATGKILKRWSLPDGFWEQLQFDETSRLLLLRRERTAKGLPAYWRLYQLDEEIPTVLCEQTNRSAATHGLAMPHGGKRFLVWDTNAVIRAYDTAGNELWKDVFPSPGYGVTAGVRLDPSGRQFAFLDSNSPGRLKLISFEDSEHPQRFKEVSTLPNSCVALSPIGQGLDGRGWVYLDHFNPNKMLPMVTTDWTRNYVSRFSPDGKFIAQGTEEGVLIISDIAEVRRRLSEL